MDSDVFSCLPEISFYLSQLCWAEEVADNMRNREWKDIGNSDEENTFNWAGRRNG